jgi:L-erythro-3,5-diaminohexanoate dehydrogenase
MHNPVTGSGGMLVGTVEEVGPDSPLGLAPGDRIATLVSLTLTPLVVHDDLAGWDGASEQVPCDGHAILFGRSIAAPLPDDLPDELALAVMDVCGAPALTHRVVAGLVDRGRPPVVVVIGAAGKSGSLALAAARQAGATRTIGVVPVPRERDALVETGLADAVALADARDPVALAAAVQESGGPGGRDRGVRRRPELRARRDPGDAAERHRDLLLDGDLVRRRGARRRGPGRRRHPDDRQRVRRGSR